MSVIPFKHQTDGACWLSDRDRGYLADPPGMGKTNTILLALKEMGSESALVACPAIVQSHWRRSAEEIGLEGDLFVASYERLVRGGFAVMSEMLMQNKIDTLVVDEAHYCKHPTSQRTKLLMGKDGYARRVERVILASGTPMPKNPQELFTQLVFLAPDVLREFGVSTMQKWTETFCVVRHVWARGVMREKVVGVQNAETLKLLLDRIMLRRESGIDLPSIWFQTLRLNTSADVSELSNWAILDFPTGTLEEIANDPHVARMRRRLGELKVKPVVEMLSSQLADSVDKVAVFAHHTDVLQGLRLGLAQYRPAFIDGSVSAGKRDTELERFQNDPRTRVFIGQNQACGTGFDGLQLATNRAILVEPSWTANENYQLARRIARTGQTRGTSIIQMICLADTLDEAIVAQNKREAEMSAAVGF